MNTGINIIKNRHSENDTFHILNLEILREFIFIMKLLSSTKGRSRGNFPEQR